MNEVIKEALDFYKNGYKTISKNEKGEDEVYVEKDSMEEFLEYSFNKIYKEALGERCYSINRLISELQTSHFIRVRNDGQDSVIPIDIKNTIDTLEYLKTYLK